VSPQLGLSEEDQKLVDELASDSFSHWYWIGPLIALVLIGVAWYFFVGGQEEALEDDSDDGLDYSDEDSKQEES
jgi:hypothetical protein